MINYMKIIKKFSKIDNFHQNFMEPVLYHKSVRKFDTIDPKYESLDEDPVIKVVIIF